MISDSPYRTGEPVLKPFMGILGGLVGTIFMIGSIKLWEPLSNYNLTDVLKVFGSLVPFGSASGLDSLVLGSGLLFLGGGVLGLFYALSEQRIPARGLLFNGIFYGLVLWVFSSIIIGSFLGDEIRDILRSWIFLFHNIIYGLCLAVFSLLAKSNRSADTAIPRD